MEFKDASAVESVVYSMRLAAVPRGRNRAMIDDLANGAPPYTLEQQSINAIAVNSNDLGMTRLTHDARQQFYGAFTKPGVFFTARTDMGTSHKRAERGAVVTKEINRIMKKSLPYFELLRSKFALDVLHGIGPSVWENRMGWCADPRGVEDILLPSGTRLTMKNVPFVAVFCPWTPRELQRLTRGPIRDPGWQMDNVEASIKWADEETHRLQSGLTWADQWMPERIAERQKENSGLYASDVVQTIDCWDFYYWTDENGEAGWSRKIIMDAQGGYGGWFDMSRESIPNKNLIGSSNQFMYDGKGRIYASELSEIIHFQFADLSAVAPFRYHSVRSLGFMLYEICHLQNRMRCKFSEAVFETLMPYMRINTSDESERALKVELATRGFIDDSVHFLTQAERWQVNHALAEMGISMNQQIIDANSSSFVQNQSYSQDRTEKTKFQVMAEVNAMTTLINAALQQAYFYQTKEYEEVFRRFCLPDSNDPEVKQFRARCLLKGVPEKMLTAEAWELEPERVMGAGNKAMEMAIAQQLMAWREFLPPAAQDQSLRWSLLAITDDPGKVALLMPEKAAHVTDSQESAMSSIGTLMQGGKFDFAESVNRVEVIEVLLVEMKLIVDRITQLGPMSTVQEILGAENLGQTAGQMIASISQDRTLKAKASQYEEALGTMMKQLEEMAKANAQSQMAQGAGQPQSDPKDAAKAQAMIIQAQTKAQIKDRESEQKTRQREETWAARQAQSEVSHNERLKQDAEKHAVELEGKIAELKAELAAKELELSHGLKIQNLQALSNAQTETEGQ